MKRVLSLALIATAVMLGCSAEGTFETGDPSSVKWAKNQNVYCMIGSQCKSVSKATCDEGGIEVPACGFDNYSSSGGNNGNSSSSGNNNNGDGYCTGSACSVTDFPYCAYYSDCDLIGGSFTQTKEECLDYNGIFATRDYCEENGYDVYNY